ncbi:MAG: adenosylmethionine--8-amino-7-oxononanoate transaminase [Candidatus Berkiella sp.]
MNATVWLPYAQMQTVLPPFEVERTQGCTLFLKDGRSLIDGIASWWSACHGYNHPHLVKAIQEQASKLPHVMMGGLIHEQAIRLASRLAAMLPGDLDYVFFSESGSVAVEIAMKMALQFWMNQQQPQKHRFISFENAYHGDTFFTMSVCDPHDGMHRLFHQVLPKQHVLPLPTSDELLNHFAAWLEKHAHECAGVLIEPLVQGAAGMKMHSAQTLHAIVKLCQQHHVLVIVDEIFTGFCRTGTLFAFEQAKISPDIICLGKALSGGMMPLAATIANKTIYDAFLMDDQSKALMHGTTFMGHALGCATANASLDLFLQEARVAQVDAINTHLHATLMPLAEVPGVQSVRTLGAIGAIELVRALTPKEMNWFTQQCVNEGIWCRPIQNVVYLTPALTINHLELSTLTDILVTQVQAWSTHFYHT